MAAKVCTTKDGNIDVDSCEDLDRAKSTLHKELVNKLCNPALISSGKSEGQMKREDALETLGLKGEPDAKKIKKAYRQLALKYGDATKSENDPEKMKQINNAYELLMKRLQPQDDNEETGGDDANDGDRGQATTTTMGLPAETIKRGREFEEQIEGEREKMQTNLKKRLAAKAAKAAKAASRVGGRRRGGRKSNRRKKARKSKRRKKARKSKRRKSRKKRSKRRKSRRKR